MAKKRKASEVSRPAGLADPHPHPPSNPGQYVLYFSLGDKKMVEIWAACYAAKKFLEAVIGDDEVTLETDKMLRTDSGIQVKCSLLKEIREHEYTKAEREWEIPYPMSETPVTFRYGPQERPTPVVEDDAPKPVSKPKRPKKERVPQSSRDGMVGIADIAKELDMSPREARGILRKSDLEKPAHGWAWSTDLEVEQVKHILTKKN